MRRHLKEFAPLYLASLLYLAFTAGMVFKIIPPSNGALFTDVLFLLFMYVACVYVATTRLVTQSKHAAVGAAFVFFVMTILLVFGFGGAWKMVPNNFKGADNYLIDNIDPFYFSVSVFTTLGFGDFVPSGPAGKILASCEALMGATHMVTFFSIIFSITSSRRSNGP